MSLVYCKSQKFLEDIDGNIIDETTGSEPYYFQNQFKSPIPITKGSKIELVSADLRINPLYEISQSLKNNALSYGIGTQAAGNFQKMTKIPSGTYSDDRLANVIENAMNETQILDLAKWDVSYQDGEHADVDNRNKFRIFLKNTPKNYVGEYHTDYNEYILLESKMGYKENNTNRDSGVGSINEEIRIANNTTNTMIGTKNFSFDKNTNDTTKSSLLVSNSAVPNLHGIFQAGGNCNLIVRPTQTYILDAAAFLATGAKFNLNKNSTFFYEVEAKAYSGSNGYDFTFDVVGAAPNIFYCKIIANQTQMDTYTMPNSANSKNIPYGNFLIMNSTDTAVNTTLLSNNYVFQVEKVDKSEITGWVGFGGTTMATDNYDLVGKTSADIKHLKDNLKTESIGCYGAFGLGVSRGECVLKGTNQTNTGTDGRYTRAGVYNTDNFTSDSEVGVEIDCDYVVQYTPNSNGKNGFLSMNYGTQAADKVAGQSGWITMTRETENAAIDLDVILPNINMGVDNILITAKVFNYNCITFYANHDTGGNLVFDEANAVSLGSSYDREEDSGIALPMNICEASAPFMPVVYTSNSYVIDKSDANYLVNGDYSILGVNKSLAKLYEYMNTNWNNAYTIPPRQPKLNVSDICVNFNMVDKIQEYTANGFSGQAGKKQIPIKDGQIDNDSGVVSFFPICVRLGEFNQNSPQATQIKDNGFEYDPSKFTTIYSNLGFGKLLITDDGDPSVSEWYSENRPEHNDSSNYIINLNNLGRLKGFNSSTSNISQMVSVIPDAELDEQEYNNDFHYTANYPLPVELNLVDDMNVNNFNISITRDNGRPAKNLEHPTSLLFRITK